MNNLIAFQLAPKRGFCNQHMLKAAAVVLGTVGLVNLDVPGSASGGAVNEIRAISSEVGRGSALPLVATCLAAKGILLVTRLIGVNFYRLSAMAAGSLYALAFGEACAFLAQAALVAIRHGNATHGAMKAFCESVSRVTARAADAVVSLPGCFVDTADFAQHGSPQKGASPMQVRSLSRRPGIGLARETKRPGTYRTPRQE